MIERHDIYPWQGDILYISENIPLPGRQKKGKKGKGEEKKGAKKGKGEEKREKGRRGREKGAKKGEKIRGGENEKRRKGIKGIN